MRISSVPVLTADKSVQSAAPSSQAAQKQAESLTVAASPKLNQDSAQLSGLAGLTKLGQTMQKHPVVFSSLAAATTGGAVGAGVGYLLPTPAIATGVGLGAAFGAGAGLAAGAGSTLVVDKWLKGKVSATTVGLISGAVAGAASGALLGMKLGGSKLMGAAAIAIPGAVAGVVGSLSASALKSAAAKP